MNRNSRIALWVGATCTALSMAAPIHAAQYEVGPGRAYAAPSDVPWEGLQAGDTVLIYWRSTPYKDKWVMSAQGTASQPVVVRGVPNAAGDLPVIDGNGATTRLALDYWNESRGVIKIGGTSIPGNVLPRYITIENLDVRGAHAGYGFTDDAGLASGYDTNAAAIYIEQGENITLRHNRLHDSGNGLFIASAGPTPTRAILVEANDIFDNGNAGSPYEHNAYTEALGITYQFNRLGPLKAGADGNNLKDRSAGLVVRYNWIEGGNRQLDLVDSHTGPIVGDPSYRETLVYGNVLIERAPEGNRQILMYGGDSGDSGFYRKGTLDFYNNTVVSYRSDRTTLFGIPTNDEHVDARNNIFYVTAGGDTLSVVDSAGIVDLAQNWFKPGFVSTFSSLSGVVTGIPSSLLGATPGFVDESAQDFRLAAGSLAKDAGAPLSSATLGAISVAYQYVKHLSGEPRPSDGLIDLGAYEVGGASPSVPAPAPAPAPLPAPAPTPAPAPPAPAPVPAPAPAPAPAPPPPTQTTLTIQSGALPDTTYGAQYRSELTAVGGVRPYRWTIVAGRLPAGVKLNGSTGAVSGTPLEWGRFDFTVQATDTAGAAVTAAVSLTIDSSFVFPGRKGKH